MNPTTGNDLVMGPMWTVTSPPGWLPRRETQGAAAEVASDGRNRRTRRTTRTGREEGAADREGVAAPAIGDRMRITAGVARVARRLALELGVRSRGRGVAAGMVRPDERWGLERTATVGAGDRKQLRSSAEREEVRREKQQVRKAE